MKTTLARLCVLVLLLLAHQSSAAQTDPLADTETHRVLFVGNSYTYFNSMPQMFKAMVEHQMPRYEVDAKFIGGGGATMEKHWEVGIALEEIRTGAWDYVVLQGQSMLGSTDLADPDSPTQFYKYVRMFDQEIRESGAKTVLFMTWSRKGQPELQRYLTHAYLTIGEELGGEVVPVGLAWDEVRRHPDIELYDPDGSHPSVTGSYLAALTFATNLFDMSTEGLPGQLNGREILRGGVLSEESSQLSSVSAETVQVLLRVVTNLTPHLDAVGDGGRN